jgi:hypothetical protein
VQIASSVAGRRRVPHRGGVEEGRVMRPAREVRMGVVRRYPGIEARDALLERMYRLDQMVPAEHRKAE